MATKAWYCDKVNKIVPKMQEPPKPRQSFSGTDTLNFTNDWIWIWNYALETLCLQCIIISQHNNGIC